MMSSSDMTPDDLDALEAALAKVKGPWLSLPGDPAFLLERSERDRAEFARDEALRNAAPALIAAARRLAELEAEVARLQEALTPSAETKAAYIGEFQFNFPVLDAEGDEVVLTPNVPWTTIKEIMAAIRARAEPKP